MKYCRELFENIISDIGYLTTSSLLLICFRFKVESVDESYEYYLTITFYEFYFISFF